MKTGIKVLACLGVGLLVAATNAEWSSGFEPPTYIGSPAGVDLNGQDGFYNPSPADSVSFKVYSYAGNALGLPANPFGGEQFVGGTGPGGSIFARSQRDMTYGDGTGLWTAAFDIAATYTGSGASNQNLGSFSTQPLDIYNPTAAAYICLTQWVDINNPTLWDANYVCFDAAGAYVYPAVVPDPAFHNLAIDHWYRWSTTFDFDSNMITEVSIMDLDTGTSATYNPTGWYLGGGAGGGLAPPNGFRFFAGAADPAGNTLAFDNLNIVPEPAGMLLLVLAGIGLRRR